jgi:hypothetical protein
VGAVIFIHHAKGGYRLWSTREGRYLTEPMDADACEARLVGSFPRGAVRSLRMMIAAARENGTSQPGRTRPAAGWEDIASPAERCPGDSER